MKFYNGWIRGACARFRLISIAMLSGWWLFLSGGVWANPVFLDLQTGPEPSMCMASLEQTSGTYESLGGGFSFQLDVTSDTCFWEAITTESWILIETTVGTGDSQVSFVLEPNTTGIPRDGLITILGAEFQVHQESPVLYTIDPISSTFPRQGGEGEIEVKPSQQSGSWTAMSDDPWIQVVEGNMGTGDGTVRFQVLENDLGTTRTGLIAINDQIHTVNQRPGCIYSISPGSRGFSYLGGSGMINVTTTAGDCPWSATSNETPIRILQGDSAIGTGSVVYEVAENISADRLLNINVGGHVFKVQQGANPEYEMILLYLLGRFNLSETQKAYADANRDGTIDVADLILIHNQVPAPTDAVFWVGEDGGNWNDGANWSTGEVPGTTDTVVLDTDHAVTVTITDDVRVRNLRARGRFRLRAPDRLVISGGTLTVEGITAIDIPFTMENGAQLNIVTTDSVCTILGPADITGSRIIVRGNGKLIAPQLTDLINVDMEIEDAGFVSMPVLRNYSATEAGHLLVMRGADTSFSCGSLQSLVNMQIQLMEGASLTLASLRQYECNLQDSVIPFDVSGVGSRLDLPILEDIFLNFSTDIRPSVRIYAGANQAPGGILNMPSLKTRSGATSSIYFVVGGGARMNLDQLQPIGRYSFQARAGGEIELPSFTGTISNMSFNADQGGTITLPSVTGSDNVSFYIDGHLEIPLMETAVDPVFSFRSTADITLPKLVSITQSLRGFNLTYVVLEDQASFSLPVLETMYNVRIRVQDSARLAMPALNSYTAFDSAVRLEITGVGTIVSADNLTTITNALIYLHEGASLRLPKVEEYIIDYSGSPILFSAEGDGALLDLSNLKSIIYTYDSPQESVFSISAYNHAIVDLSSLVSYQMDYPDNMRFVASSGGEIKLDQLGVSANNYFDVGVDSLISLPSMVGIASEWIVKVHPGGSLSLPNVTSLYDIYMIMDGSFDFPKVTLVDSCNLVINGSEALELPLLEEIRFTPGVSLPRITMSGSTSLSMPKLTTISDARITISESASITAPALTDFTATIDTNLSTSNRYTLIMDGDATGFTANQLSNFRNNRIQLRNGARIALPSLAQYAYDLAGSAICFDVAGDSSFLDLSGLSSFVLNTDLPEGRILSIYSGDAAGESGGFIDLSSLTAPMRGPLDQIEIAVSNQGSIDLAQWQDNEMLILKSTMGSSLSIPSLPTSLNQCSLITQSEGDLVFPGVTQLTGTVMNISGKLSMPQLKSVIDPQFTFDGEANIILPELTTIAASSVAATSIMDVKGNANVTLPKLNNMTNVDVNVFGDGSMVVAALKRYRSFNNDRTLTMQGAGSVFSADNLTSFTDMKVELSGGANLSLPALRTYDFITNSSFDRLFQVSGQDSHLDLSNLDTIVFDSGFPNQRVINFVAGSSQAPGGSIDMSGLTNLELAPNHIINFRADYNGVVDISALNPLPSGAQIIETNGGTVAH